MVNTDLAILQKPEQMPKLMQPAAAAMALAADGPYFLRILPESEAKTAATAAADGHSTWVLADTHLHCPTQLKFLDGQPPIKECGESLVEVDSLAAQHMKPNNMQSKLGMGMGMGMENHHFCHDSADFRGTPGKLTFIT